MGACMKESINTLFAIVPPEEDDLKEFSMKDTLSYTEDGAWERFCYPALKRSGYENDGYRARKVFITIEVLED